MNYQKLISDVLKRKKVEAGTYEFNITVHQEMREYHEEFYEYGENLKVIKHTISEPTMKLAHVIKFKSVDHGVEMARFDLTPEEIDELPKTLTITI